MTQESLSDEHRRLLAQMEQLRREHIELEQQDPPNLEAHTEHRARLHAQLRELQAHLARLKRDPRKP